MPPTSLLSEKVQQLALAREDMFRLHGLQVKMAVKKG